MTGWYRMTTAFLIPLPERLQVLRSGSFVSYLLGPDLSLHHRLRIIDRALVALTSSRARIHSDYTHIPCSSSCESIRGVIATSTTPWCASSLLHWDRLLSSGDVEYLRVCEEGSRTDQPFHMMVFDAPTSEAWFQHWHRHLARTLNVEIFVRHEVSAIHAAPDGNIEGVTVTNKDDPSSSSRKWKADAYINALPPHIAAQVLLHILPNQIAMRELARIGLVYLPGSNSFSTSRCCSRPLPAGVFLVNTTVAAHHRAPGVDLASRSKRYVRLLLLLRRRLLHLSVSWARLARPQMRHHNAMISVRGHTLASPKYTEEATSKMCGRSPCVTTIAQVCMLRKGGGGTNVPKPR